MDKNEVRQLIMNRRHELSDEDIEMQSELIIDRLKKSDIYKTSENVFLYMPDCKLILNKKEMEEMTADAEEYSSEERDELQEYINDLQKEKDYYWNKFLERKRQKESYVFEKEIENIMAWKSQLDTLLDTENL